MDKNALLKQVDDIYAIVSTLNANGDAIDTLAAVRSMLRKLRADIDKAQKACENAVGKSSGIPTTAVAEPAKEVPDGGQNDR